MAKLVDVAVVLAARPDRVQDALNVGTLGLAGAEIKLPVPANVDLLTDQQLEDWVRVAALKLLPAITLRDPKALREFFKKAASGG